MQENPEYSVFSLQTMGFYCILLGLNRKLGKFWPNVCKFDRLFRKIRIFAKTNPKIGKLQAKCLQIQSNFPKTREIRGKMSNILAKWLHYLWIFPNIRDILINLLHLRGDFSENSGNSCQNTHINVIFFYP